MMNKFLPRHAVYLLWKLTQKDAPVVFQYALSDLNYENLLTYPDGFVGTFRQFKSQNLINEFKLFIAKDYFRKNIAEYLVGDVDEHGRAIGARIDTDKLAGDNYFGLGDNLFEKYKKECCQSGFHDSILSPVSDLQLSADELKNVDFDKAHIHEELILKDIHVEIELEKEHVANAKNFLSEYLQKFRDNKLATSKSHKQRLDSEICLGIIRKYFNAYLQEYVANRIVFNINKLINPGGLHSFSGLKEDILPKVSILESILYLNKSDVIEVINISPENYIKGRWDFTVEIQDKDLFQDIKTKNEIFGGDIDLIEQFTSEDSLDEKVITQTKNKISRNINLKSKSLCFKNNCVTLGGGQNDIFRELFEGKELRVEDNYLVWGKPTQRQRLENKGGYKNEGSFRRALAKVRDKLKEAHTKKEFPKLKIASKSTNPKLVFEENNYLLTHPLSIVQKE